MNYVEVTKYVDEIFNPDARNPIEIFTFDKQNEKKQSFELFMDRLQNISSTVLTEYHFVQNDWSPFIRYRKMCVI